MLRLIKKLRLRRDTIKKLTEVELDGVKAGIDALCPYHTHRDSCAGVATSLPE